MKLRSRRVKKVSPNVEAELEGLERLDRHTEIDQNIRKEMNARLTALQAEADNLSRRGGYNL